MNHLELLKRAFRLTWRYRPLWIFGFLLALCGGGGGGGGGGNFSFPGGGDLEKSLPNLPNIDVATVIAVIVGVVALILLLALLGIVVRAVSRTAMIGMVRHIQEEDTITPADGWRVGWSAGAWRLFLVNLLIGIPVAIFSLCLLLIALAPLLLLFSNNDALKIIGVIITIAAVLAVILVLILIHVVVAPIQELTWRRTVLDQQGVLASLRDAFALLKRRLKDIAVLWLIMFGIGLGWGFVALIVVLPASLLAAAMVGGIPAALVYIISRSGLGAAVAGIPLGLLALILVSSFATGLYLVFQSAVWTLAYLDIQAPAVAEDSPTEDKGPQTGDQDQESPALSEA